MKTLAAAVAALAVVAAQPVAAATFITEIGPAADGSLSWDLGNDGGIAAGPFDDLFTIVIPADGLAAGSVTATFTSKTNDLDFTAVTFAGHSFALFSTPAHNFGFLAPFEIAGGTYTLEVEGTSPGIAGDYSGTLSFTPVPEAATWALMIGGLGLSGGLLRIRRRVAQAG